MSKLAENIIKNAYQNRANAVIAAKQAADEGKFQKAMQWLNDPANKGKATAIESGLGGLAAGGLGFGLTKALGGSTGRAWANAGIAGGSTAAGIAGLKYRGEIKDALRNALTSRLSKQELADMKTVLDAQTDNGTDPRLNSLKQMLKQAESGNLPKESVRYLREQMKGNWTMPTDWMDKQIEKDKQDRVKASTGKDVIGEAPDNVPANDGSFGAAPGSTPSTYKPKDTNSNVRSWANGNRKSEIDQQLSRLYRSDLTPTVQAEIDRLMKERASL